MPTLLAIEVSPRHELSTSRKLTAHFIERWKAAYPGSAVVVRDLMKTPPPFVDLAWIAGAFTPREQHSPESAAAIKVSDDLVAELEAADHIVIGTPMFNFSIPAVLKAYIDQIVRVGVTVSPNNVGLLTGKEGHRRLGKRRRLQPRLRPSRNTIRRAAIFARCWGGSGLPTSRSSWPTAHAPAPQVSQRSSSSASRSGRPQPSRQPSRRDGAPIVSEEGAPSCSLRGHERGGVQGVRRVKTAAALNSCWQWAARAFRRRTWTRSPGIGCGALTSASMPKSPRAADRGFLGADISTRRRHADARDRSHGRPRPCRRLARSGRTLNVGARPSPPIRPSRSNSIIRGRF